MQLLFDVKRSLAANPPNYPTDKGIIHIERKRGKLSSLRTENEKGISLQPREKNLEDTQRTTEHSFRVNNVMYNKEVMVAEDCDDGVEELISGYGRKYTFDKMGVDNYFWDLVKFESPYWKAIWKRRLNASKDHIANGTPNTEGTYLKGLVELKKTTSFKFKNDDDVKIALFDMSDEQLDEDQIEKLLKKFRKSNSIEEGVIGLTQKDANDIAKALGLPSSGYVKDTSSPAWDTLGYVRYNGDISNKIVDFVNQYNNYGQKILITGFIEYVVHDRIGKQREAWIKQLNKGIEWMKNHLDKRYHNILEFQGFIAQINTPDDTQGGNPRERGLVDVKGKIIRE
tara:strand:- start:284 stop:1306 length:1023 start_codon:yes stop_codon:yes gene_type:complete